MTKNHHKIRNKPIKTIEQHHICIQKLLYSNVNLTYSILINHGMFEVHQMVEYFVFANIVSESYKTKIFIVYGIYLIRL